MNPYIDTTINAIGAIAAIGLPTTGAVFVAGRWLIKKWLEQKFEERLLALKMEQDSALKHIQSSIDHQIHRAKKLYDLEFDALTESWRMLGKLYSNIIETTHLPPPHPEWKSAAKNDIRLSLDTETEFTEDEKKQILDSLDPENEFCAIYNFRRLRTYQEENIEFGKYLFSHGIFIRPEIREKYDQLIILLTSALSEFAANIRANRPARQKYLQLNTEGKKIRNELRELIEGRLWSAADKEKQENTRPLQ